MQYQQDIENLGVRVTGLVTAVENGEDVELDALQQQVETIRARLAATSLDELHAGRIAVAAEEIGAP